MALCDKMGANASWSSRTGTASSRRFLAKKYDAIVASMSITEERKKRVDFTSKYYHEPAKFVAAGRTPASTTRPEGMAGKTVGVQRGTIHQCYMEKVFPDTELRLYGTQDEVFLDLSAGRIDARSPADSVAIKDGFLNTDAGQGFRLRRRSPVRPGMPRRGRRHRGAQGRGRPARMRSTPRSRRSATTAPTRDQRQVLRASTSMARRRA